VFPRRINTLGWIFAAFVALALIEYRLGILAPLERRSTDLLTRIHAASVASDPAIVIVDIDDRSLSRMSELADRWPWPRSVHGELAAGLAGDTPKAIVFDLLLGEPDRTRPESDELFNQLIAPLSNVYFATVRGDRQADPYGVLLRDMAQPLGMLYLRDAHVDARANLLVPLAIRKQNARLGVINALQDADGLLRRSYLYLPAYGWKIPSLPARVAADLGYRMPEGESILLNWSASGHRHFSYSDLYEDFNREHRQLDASAFRDKIIVIGSSATGLYDLRATPLSETYPGVEVMATALDNLKNQTWMRLAPAWLPLLVTAAIMAAICVAFSRGAHTLQIGVVTIGGLVLLLLLSYAALGQRIVLPMLTPVIFGVSLYFACALHEYLRERRERLRAVDYFSRFVNPHVVKDLLAHGGLSKDGESREITVLFSDIRGFTTLSETRKPTEVVSILNRYFGRQVEVIFRHGGCLDKFIGDAIMAIWGAPLDDPDHAKHAVMAALEMSEALEQFRLELGELGRSFDVGIGIHSGPAVVGIIGSENKREYTAIGDTVNLASRIEGLTKGVARVLVSEDTMRACAGAFAFGDRGSHKVKGREQAVRLYEPSGKINENQK
jgi:adenylate cyclase